MAGTLRSALHPQRARLIRSAGLALNTCLTRFPSALRGGCTASLMPRFGNFAASPANVWSSTPASDCQQTGFSGAWPAAIDEAEHLFDPMR